MTPPRIVVPGATTALVRRTSMRKAFLAPWDPMVEKIWLYALADAQRETNVAIHFSGLYVTHHHTDVTPVSNNLPEFTRRMHRDLSCGLHTLLCERKYDAPRELFDDRPSHWTRLLDAPAQASRLVYDAVNAVAAGLVARPEHMPMRFLDFGYWKTGYIEVERPSLYFQNDRPKHLKLRLTPPPLLYRALGGDLEALIYHMGRLVDGAVRRIRTTQTRPVLGAKQLRRLHPWSEPRTMREPGPSPHRTFRIGADDILGRRQRVSAAVEVRGFRQNHEATRVARRDGDVDARYPYGTYAAHVYYGAPVAAVTTDAIVTAPGPTLEDIQAECRLTVSGRSGEREDAHAVLQEVRAAFDAEAEAIAEDAALDLVTTVAKPVIRSADHDEREPAVVRHRFERRRYETARRIVTLRDRRRGRPPGSDPPHN